MTDPSARGPELLVSDTSFVGVIGLRRTDPERVAHWDEDVLARIDRASNAISVVTIAEARAGFLNAGWGPRRIEAEERRLQSWALLPLDTEIVDEWARLRDFARSNGLVLGDNDLWIAATAATYDAALVTCDRDHLRLAAALPEVLYLPPRPDDGLGSADQ